MDRWYDLKEPCPGCGGVVESWYFGTDCRGNAPSSGIDCKDCKRSFTKEAWEVWKESYNKKKE
jgi:hypothetical protein